MRVFLDIGAHDGETLAVVLEKGWTFDRIVCFEPARACWSKIEAMADSRVEVNRFGLWSTDARMLLHNPGYIGASTAGDKDPATRSELCEFRDASRWFSENLANGDQVYAKINVEGAEADIIDSLAKTGEIRKISHLLIHFDVRKVPSLQNREAAMRSQLEHARIDYQTADQIQHGGVVRGTRNWLRWSMSTSPMRDLRYKVLRRLGHRLRVHVYPVKKLIKRHLGR